MTFPKDLQTMHEVFASPLRTSCAVLAVTVFAVGCSSTRNQAPVEERSVGGRAAAPAATPAAPTPPADAAKLPLGQENLGKPGYYQVKPGETLIRIALDNGQNWRDVARWSGLDNPNVIEVGQVLRVAPPVETGTATRAVGTGRVETRPLDARPVAGGASAPPAAAAPVAPPVAAPAPPVAAGSDDDVNWQWPASGSVTANFEEGRSKGLVLAGKAGDPVYAAAEGRVVYAGSGLRGYGNLVILKHNNTYLTAYAHNQALLVKEDQTVRRGQKIAEMGSTDADKVQLHFEIRRQGKPVDPSKLLPPR